MAINQPRRKQPAAEVNTLPCGHLAFGHNGFNASAAYQQRMMIHESVRLRTTGIEGGQADVSPDYAFGKGMCHRGQLVMGCIDIYFDSARNVNSDSSKMLFICDKKRPVADADDVKA
jgi:hypothetical protein